MINNKFDVGDEVKIIPFENWQGIVILVCYDGYFIDYKVRYYDNGKVQEMYFFEKDLELMFNASKNKLS